MSNQLPNRGPNRGPVSPRFLPPKPKPAAPVPPPRNPAVDEIIQMAGRLIAMMEQETALLEQMKVADVAEGQVEKDRLARSFEAKLRALAADKKAAEVAPAIRAEFRQVMDKFRAAMRANERSLRAAKDANERVVKAIVDAAQAQAAPRHAYSAAGTIGGSNGYDRVAPAPVALDRTL
ncbi:MAG: hypothetical protein JNM30_04430 [Rhodospirillales bacterium]|nr:hypothetical protein [Rhodospirillales bacterium]